MDKFTHQEIQTPKITASLQYRLDEICALLAYFIYNLACENEKVKEYKSGTFLSLITMASHWL